MDGPDKTVTVSGTVTGASLAGPEDVTLVIRDDDAPGEPGNFEAVAGNGEVSLSWTAPDPLGSPVTKYQYRYKTDGGYPQTWTDVPQSGSGEANETSYTVTGLTNGTAYTFQLRAATATEEGTAVESEAVTPVQPVVTLVLTPAEIAESGAEHVSVVTATVEPASGSAFTVAVEAAAVSPAVSGDFVLSTNRTLSFAAGRRRARGR